MGTGRAVLLGLACVYLLGCHSGARPLAHSRPRPCPEPEVPSVALNGRVEDLDHRAVRMARVILREGHHGWEQDAYTDETGAFDFRIDYWTPYTLYVFDDRHPFGAFSERIEVTRRRPPPDPLVITLGTASSVSVRVVGPDGGPVAGASVHLWGSEAEDPSQSTDEEGRALFRLVRPGRLEVAGGLPGLVGAHASVDASPGQAAEVVLRLDRARHVRGRVVDPTGAAVAGVVVLAHWSTADDARGGTSTRTGADGRFDLRGVPLTPVRVTTDYGPLPLAPAEPVEVAATQGEVELRLRRHGTLRGSVLGADGRPDPEAEVLVLSYGRGGAEPVDPAGRFESGRLEPGEWVVVARHGTSSQRAHASVPEAGEATVTLTLADRRFTVRGRVVDAMDRRPLEGATVSAFRLMDRRMDDRGHAPMAGTTTDGDGRFALGGVSDDLWYLLVRTPGHGSRLLHLEPAGADQDLGTVALPAGDPDHDAQGEPSLIP